MKRSVVFILIAFSFCIYNIEAQTWSGLGTGVGGFSNSAVEALANYNSAVYVGGAFSTAGNIAADNIAKWDGTNWSPLGTGLNYSPNAFVVYANELYVAGSFTIAGGISVNRIAKWDGTSWSSVGSGMNGVIFCLAVYNGELYAGGSFSSAGGVLANNIAKWNGTVWSPVGTGMDIGMGTPTVNVLISLNGELYAGGNFTIVDGTSANYIAKYNGTSWTSLGTGMSGGLGGARVNALAEYDGELYAGGDFDTSGGTFTKSIAKWNGIVWSSVGTGVGSPNPEVFALAVYNSELFAGGRFTTAGGNPAEYIAKWNGTTWSSVGTGMSGGVPNAQVLALASINGDLYAGGSFTFSGADSTNGIAKWNSSVGFEDVLKENKSPYIFPNPTTNYFTIDLGSENINSGIVITDITGKIIYSTTTHLTEKIEVNTIDFANGFYFVQFKNNKEHVSMKVIVQH
jgi:hypothetical protein